MVPHIIAFAAGIWWLQQQAVLPEPVWAGWLLPGVLLALLLRADAGPVRVMRLLLTLALCAAAGFFWATACAQWRMADALPQEWEGRDITVTGVVAGLPQTYERSLRFAFDVESVATPGARVPRRIVLSWWGEPRRDDLQQERPRVAPGERWRLVVRLKRPHGYSNPHGFDYEA
ncbi:MAG: ComEC/Rec2 family competence protein [Burkholderiales bacterium]